MFTACKHAPVETCHKITLQGVVYQMDVALDDVNTQRAGIVFIYNMSSSKYSNFDYELSQKILGLLKGAYPARLKKVLIVTAPLWFKAPFKILRLFVREKLRDRVFMVNASQLPLHIPREALPIELGGKLRMDHLTWLNRCHSSVAKSKNELCDLASYNVFPLITNRNCAIDDNSQSSNGRVSDEEEQSLNDLSLIGAELDGSANGHGLNHATAADGKTDSSNSPNLVPGVKRTPKKPEKIIMPPEMRMDSPEMVSAMMNTTNPMFSGDILHMDTDEGISIEEFIQVMKEKGRKGLFDEYNEIKSKFADGTFEVSRLRANHSKNRYTDVLCYDHSRVRLSLLDEDPTDDYLNANFVDGYMQKNAFISTQGPLPKTSGDFWRMVWEQETVVIVMTTRTVERYRQKCGQYWPLDDESNVEFDNFQIFNNGVEQFTDYVISSLVLSNKKVRSFAFDCISVLN